MHPDLDSGLLEIIKEIETHFSNPDRKGNKKQETYKFEDVERFEDVAYLWFKKNTDYWAIVVAIKRGDGKWIYFFPKHSHKGLEHINDYLVRQEEINRIKSKLHKNGLKV